MASQACYQFTVVDSAGNIQPGATVTVNAESGGSPLATLYSDRAGASPISNPMTADSAGFVQFFLAGGVYKITATYGSSTRVWRYVPISRASEMLPATDGYIPFASDNGLTTDSKLFWDNTNKQLLVGLGAAALPSYGFVGDADTGMWSPGANTVAWSTGGSERMRIDSSGNVGIGLSPSFKLDVKAPSNDGIRFTDSTGAQFRGWFFNRSDAGGQLRLYSGSSVLGSVISCDTDSYIQGGNVGIGTTSISAKLHVLATAEQLRLGYSAGVYTTFTTSSDGGFSIAPNAYFAINSPCYFISSFVVRGNISDDTHTYLSINGGTSGITNFTNKVGVNNNAAVNALDVSGSIGFGAPVTKTADFSLAAAENSIICNKAGTTTVTLPAASSWTGRRVRIQTITANTVVSASSNVVPRAGGAAGTAILAATAGAWAELESDGTNWKIMTGS